MNKEEDFIPPDDTYRIIARVPQEELVFVDMIFKSYEGIAMMTLDEGEEGIIKLDVTPGTHKIAREILQDLQSRFPVEIKKDELELE
ncbi:DUF4911 domain-containing protein [Halarsenatibacter silvermanii]|uniref:DUF4911 domain-containing protein n=1 Tax=Halarsenatibacter silvermanii TaxID=321763 RepID=A0A1G9K1L5_9FIRM|nr:DUF4911 domain-containing protein [Halarsenatibacter silvermanii]SDL43346.1 protein of unknown function [Halarsenatibacter silvermanii]